MKHKVLALVGSLLIAGFLFAADSSKKEARITRIVREVKVLPANAPATPAELNQLIKESSGVRTGDESRSELTFVDLTITRLGANTIFSFNRAGRTAELETGQMLLRVPKDSGGATIKAIAVTVGIAGTTVIFEGNRAGAGKLIVLEGGAQMRLNKYPKQSKHVNAGQMLDVKAGATSLPDPVPANLGQIMKTHPLITDFPPLPSQDLIAAAVNQHGSSNQPVYQSNPVGGSPVTTQPIIPLPIPIIGGFPIGHAPSGTTTSVPSSHTTHHGKPSKTPGSSSTSTRVQTSDVGYRSPTPAPSPSSKTRKPGRSKPSRPVGN
jgi:hypothetical protein